MPAEKSEEESVRKTAYGRFTYGNTKDRNSECCFADYIRDSRIQNRLLHRHIHVDPDFTNATYGDPAKREKNGKLVNVPKSATLRELEPDHLLVFCASLDPFPTHYGRATRALYILGYFVVKAYPYDFFQMNIDERWETCKKFKKANVHCAQATSKEEMSEWYFRHLVLIEGEKRESTLLNKAVKLTDEKYRILPKWASEFGLNPTLFTIGGRWLPQADRSSSRKRMTFVSRLKKELKSHGEYEQHLRTT